jgi:hypothetical protein
MNQQENDNLLLAIREYKHVCVSIELYTEFFTSTSFQKIINPITDRKTIQTGLYGTVGETGIWVSKLSDILGATDKSYHIRVSNRDDTTTFKNTKAEGWSSLLSLEKFDRLNKLKAFW